MKNCVLKITSLLLVSAIILCSFGFMSALAVEETTDVVESNLNDDITASFTPDGVAGGVGLFDYILASSLILYDGESQYYRYGISDTLVANGKPCPMFKKNEVSFISVLSLKGLIGVESFWDHDTETVTLKKDDTTVSIRIGEDAINVNGNLKYNSTVAYYSGEAVMVPMSALLVYFGYKVTEKDKFTFVTSNDFEFPTLDAECGAKLNELFENFYFNADFENGTSGFSFTSNWGGSKKGNGLMSDSEGNQFLYMSATDTGWEGYQSGNIYRGSGYGIKDTSYIVEFSYKFSEDFVGNSLGLAIFVHDGSSYKGIISLGSVSETETGKWHRGRFCISSKSLPKVHRDYDHDSFRLMLRVVSAGNGEKCGGQVYIDDVQVMGYNPAERYINAGMHADEYAAWYVIGDDVSYSPQHPERIADAQTVTGTIYNLEGEIVDTVTHDIKTVLEHGWNWTPKENGWYEVEFTADYADGSYADLITLRTLKNSGTSYDDLYRLRPSFFVAPTKTKPVSERHDTLYYNTSRIDPERDYDNHFNRLAMEIMGFKGVRCWLYWGESAGSKKGGIEHVEDVYNWSEVDGMIETCKKYGIEDVIACVIGTPKWAAVPAEEMKDANGSQLNPTSVSKIGLYTYNTYAPDDISDWEEFLHDFATRYHDEIDVWEIWNEPADVQSAFWMDTPENYMKLVKSACKTIRNVDPDALVSVAGMGKGRHYVNLMDKLLDLDVTLLDDVDYWAVHGQYLSMDGVRERLVAAGHPDMPYINTEAYFAHRSPTTDYSKNVTAMTAVITYLSAYKEDVSRLCFYDILNTGSEEESQDYAIFRRTPFIEPKESAATLYTLFDLMEKNFAYEAEYETANGQKMVLCKNGEGNIAVLWNPDGTEESIDPYVLECMTKTSKIISADGRIKDEARVPVEHLVYITDLDFEKINVLKGDPDTAINAGYIKPEYFCKTNVDLEAEKLSKLVSMDNAAVKPFDESTYVVSEEVIWTENNYEWQSASGTTAKPVGYSAKHTAYIDEKGLWLMVDVTDNSVVTPVGAKKIWAADSIQFALKVSNDDKSPQHEFSVGLVEGKPVIYKEIAAYGGTDMPPANYTNAKNVVENAKVSIETTNHGLLYKVHLPASQLWPYSYMDSDEYIRFSLCVNNDDGDGRIGWLQWSSGIASGGKDSNLYGKIDFK